MKTCTKCGEAKAVAEFSKNAQKRDGLRCSCKACDNASNAKWFAANPEKKREYDVSWRATNPDKARAKSAKWKAANTEKVKAWKTANPAKLKSYCAKWRVANTDVLRIHHQNRRARKRESGGKLSMGLAEKLFKLQRGMCACGCQQPLGDDFHLDHRMPLALGGTNTDHNMQLLRATCNRQKHAKHPVDFMRSRGFLI